MEQLVSNQPKGEDFEKSKAQGKIGDVANLDNLLND